MFDHLHNVLLLYILNRFLIQKVFVLSVYYERVHLAKFYYFLHFLFSCSFQYDLVNLYVTVTILMSNCLPIYSFVSSSPNNIKMLSLEKIWEAYKKMTYRNKGVYGGKTVLADSKWNRRICDIRQLSCEIIDWMQIVWMSEIWIFNIRVKLRWRSELI